MKFSPISLALAALTFCAAGSSAAQEANPALTLEHRMLLRCSAAFALVAHGQSAGNAAALAYPPMEETGREFFVRATAKVMDQARLDRDAISRQMSAEAQAIWDNDELARIMPVCLNLMGNGEG